MKAIMISIRPQYVVKILNGEKTIEIRKRFPSDYVGWVYIYCTKVPLSKQYWLLDKDNKGNFQSPYGKVVARFWCDKVEEINIYGEVVTHFSTENIKEDELLKKSCLSYSEMFYYFDNCENGYAIHITKLEIFDEPKELSNFTVVSHKVSGADEQGKKKTFTILKPLTKPFQSWGYIEVLL